MVSGRHIPFASLLDHLAGRPDESVAAHVGECGACRATAERARRLLAAGRRAASLPQPSARLLRRARTIFGDARRKRRRGLLELVLDTLRQPAPALRSAAAATRFLRFEGEVTVEIGVSAGARGLEMRGQITPADHCIEVVLVAGRTRRRARVDEDGAFVFRNVPAREVDLLLGDVSIAGLKL